MATANNSKSSAKSSNIASKMISSTASYANLNSINSIYGTTSPYYSFSSNIDASNFEFLTLAVKFLSEEELDKLLSDIIDRAKQITEDIGLLISGSIKGIVKTRHVSEDFLLKYYDYLDKSDILALHTPDITSGGYPQLALLLMNDESKAGNIRESR